ncbi:hypothetical protein [Robiginitalea sp. SC105]|uniref:hypothetical protein n=1 Tax=Robiginitalea sp. SC105 TaxID=2762332 RepID=UPI00163B1AB0|nr:hypothetical protein [Robiginitalea sp. SC105]MBC2840080.1 hypothetical protein [Robiginitalea sp. SC105]
MKTRFIILMVIMAGCSSPQESITESEVISTIEGFFKALDVENDNPELLDHYITGDFMIFEDGLKMNREEFREFVSEAGPILKTDWELSDFKVSLDEHSAHVRLFNQGTFIVRSDSFRIKLKNQWLESAFLVREKDSLKIRFYFSDNIGRESDTIQ